MIVVSSQGISKLGLRRAEMPADFCITGIMHSRNFADISTSPLKVL